MPECCTIQIIATYVALIFIWKEFILSSFMHETRLKRELSLGENELKVKKKRTGEVMKWQRLEDKGERCRARDHRRPKYIMTK